MDKKVSAGEVPDTAAGGAASPVTARAICLGFFLSLVIDLWMAYNDFYLNNSLMIGNHFPFVSIVAVILLVLGVNTAARKWFGSPGLQPGELLLVWGMIGIAGSVCSAGLVRYLLSWVAVPAYYANGSNEYDIYVIKHLPSWMLLARDPADKALRWFMEGLPRGESIPWGAWVVPLTAWFTFGLLLWSANFSMCSVFFRQWSERERLIFPLVHLPVEVARQPEGKNLLNSFLSNRLTWIGAAIPFIIWGVNGLRTWIPGIPQFPLSWPMWGLFPDRPWSDFSLDGANIYFSVIGMTFLLTTEVAFSLWGFFVLYKLSFVYVAWLGSGATGFWGGWDQRVAVFDSAGAIIAITVFLFWTARRSLLDWLVRAIKGRKGAEQDPIPPRLALFLAVAGMLGMAGWMVLAGAQWWASALAVALYVAILFVLTRIVSEAGLLFVQSSVVPFDVISGLFPPSWFGGTTLATMTMQKGVMMSDLRETLMPYVMNGMRACRSARLNMTKVMAVFGVTVLFALAVSAYARIATNYKYGAVNMDQYATVQSPSEFLGPLANYQKNLPEFEKMKLGGKDIMPVNLAHLAVGAALSAGMLVMRAKFLWWPLHPFGLVTCATWAMSMIWFSIFLAWVAKTCVMTFGGAAVYRRVLPLFLGMVLGESLIAATLMVAGIITGRPGIPVLPY